MNLNQLEVLVAIVETGSLTEAAESVGLTQSAVSHSLSKLEAELGVTLLERGRQGVSVTRIGADVLQHARAILSQVEVIRQKTARERGLSVGKLRFGCVPTIPPRMLTGILRDFQHKYPDIDVVLFEGAPAELSDWLNAGVVDIATVVNPTGYPLLARLVRNEIHAIVSHQHELAAQNSISFGQLQGYAFVGPKAEYGILNNVPPFKDVTLPRMQYEVSTQQTILTMVRENMGVSMMPSMLIDDAEGLVQLQFDPPIFLEVYLAARVASPAAGAFLEMAQRWTQEHGFVEKSDK